MKLKVFEVVELLDGNKATILENNKIDIKQKLLINMEKVKAQNILPKQI